MTSYQFTGAYPTFYPDERDAQGKSLMAEPGMVVEFDGLPPSDGQWIPVEASPVVTAEVPLAGPEPALEAPAPEPVPVAEPPAPEPAPAVVEPPAPEPLSEPEPAREPVPAPEPAVPVLGPRFGYISPYART